MITIFRGIDLDTNNALYRITALDSVRIIRNSIGSRIL